MRKEALHVFGVDFFGEKEILEFFVDFKPQKLEWINDSSVNVAFATVEDASNALFSKTTPTEGPEPHELDCRIGLDIEKDGKQFNFKIRFCTSEVRKQLLLTSGH